MEESFTITVLDKGIEKELAGRLRISTYTYQFLFEIGDSEIILERDDEGNFRALGSQAVPGKKPDPSLVQTLIRAMEEIMKE
ncbi:MAG TPA: hypothetical protein VGM24_05500 [Puia sp.]|jgi:hypothetical protein